MIVLGAPKLGFAGGVERHVYDLARGLRSRGLRVALVYQSPDGRNAEEYAQGFDEVRPANDAAGLFAGATHYYGHKLTPEAAHAPLHIPAMLAVHDHDLTCMRRHRYLPLGQAPCHRSPGIACIASGCCVIRTPGHGLGVTLAHPFDLARDARAIAQRSILVCASEYLASGLRAVGVPHSRISVVHPVPDRAARPVTAAPQDDRILFVGQLIRGKGVDLLLEALAKLPNVELRVAGDGDAKPELQALAARLGIERRVDWLGAVSAAQVDDLYDDARAVVVPSRWPEPFGMVGVEAMRRGRPVAAPLHGGVPEWLSRGSGGFGYIPGDIDGMCGAIRRALHAASDVALMEAAVARAASEFSHAAMVDRIESLLFQRAAA